MERNETLSKAIMNVISKGIVNSLDEPLRNIVKEYEKALATHNQSKLLENESLIRNSYAITQQLLISLNTKIDRLQSDLEEERKKNTNLKKREAILWAVSIIMALVSIILGIVAFYR